ncbi:MAG: metallophosphoesterase [Nitrososphaerota archaeon]|nr:metallophosphoesterase [Candidatus Calditenuis fumarioli]
MRLGRRSFLAGSVIAIASFAGVLSTQLTYELQITRLRVDLGGRLAFVPDLHYHRPSEGHVRNLLEALDREDPDAVVLAGDVVDEETSDVESLGSVLSRIESDLKLAVLGNHDYWSGKAGEVASMLRGHGFRVLLDDLVETPIGKVYGFDWREDRRYRPVMVDGIVIAHDPNAADSVSGNALVLAGHTHGGFSIGGLTLYSNSRYSRGLYELGSVRLYVSRGVGQMTHQIRINSPPELLIVE